MRKSKDTYWFSHDSNAGRDLKLIRIRHMYTHWGIGVFWDVIEVLREQKNYKYPCDDSNLQMLCGSIFCSDFTKFKNWFNDCVKIELFEIKDNYFYSNSLVLRMKIWESKKKNGSKRNASESGSETRAKSKRKSSSIVYSNIEHSNSKEGGDTPLPIPDHPLIAEIKEKYPDVAKLTLPTPEQCDKLLTQFGMELIASKLEGMQNKKDLLKKYKSCYLTLKNWCEGEGGKGQAQIPLNETPEQKEARVTALFLNRQ